MRIGIDISPMALPYPNGTGTYARNLLTALTHIDTRNEYFLFSPRDVSINLPPNFHFVVLTSHFPFLKRQLIYPWIMDSYSTSIFHTLTPFASLFFRHPRLITSLQDIRLNEIYPPSLQFALQSRYDAYLRTHTLKRSKMIITPTEQTKRDVLASFQSSSSIPPISVIPHGTVVSAFSRRKRKGILCFMDYSPRKNIHATLQAVSLLPDRIKAEHPVSIIASPTASEDMLRSLKRMYKLPNLTIYQSLNDTEVTDLYKRNALLLYPSLYEGFGLPILEAMGAGCVVITSNYGAMKEVSGTAGKMVNPRSPRHIAAAVLDLLQHTEKTEMFRKRGYTHAGRYTWERTARETLHLYEKVQNA